MARTRGKKMMEDERREDYFDDLEFEDDLTIDKNSLDDEWLNQSLLYSKYARAASAAKKEMDMCHERVKVVRSELTKECKEKNKSATGPMIEAYYRTHRKHKRAKQNLIDAEYHYNLMNTAVFSFQQRKSALADLVRLWMGEYFSTPSIGKEEGADYDRKTTKRRTIEKEITDNLSRSIKDKK